MSNHTIARLAAANPVPDPPSVEPPERLRRLIEAEGPPPRAHARRRRARGNAVRALAVAAVAVAASFTGLVLDDGSSSPGVNVAAAAYAATSAGGGVVEARFVERVFLAHGRVARSHYREWIDASAGMRRERRVLATLLGRRPDLVYELASSPGWIETWSSEAGEMNVIHRIRYPAGRGPAGIPQPLSGGGATQAPAGIATYRRLYRERSLRLVGHEHRNGRLLWKLEGDVAYAVRSFRAKPIAFEAVVVLVDPRTYLPVVQRTIDLLARHRRRVETESDLLSYGRLPSGVASKALLKLSAQHPHAQVVTGATRSPGSHYVRVRTP
jgi:hypothetical protein